MMKRSLRSFVSSWAAGLLGMASAAGAVPVSIVHADVPSCDPLVMPSELHELGTGLAFDAFPDERISASASPTALSPCPASDDPGAANVLVSITNLTGTAWAELWYVADAPSGSSGTIFSNFDGFVDDVSTPIFGGEAFRIDAVGANAPLISESISADGIFAPGETWDFVIQDYLNFSGLGADLLDSIGVASLSSGEPPSTGSILGLAVVPEPGAGTMLILGLALLAQRRSPRRTR